jgi:hypothetical protein
MLRRLAAIVSTLAIVVVGLCASAPLASASGGQCRQWNESHTVCLVFIEVPHDEPGDPGDDGDGSTGSASTSKCVFVDGVEIPCTYFGAPYNSKYACYMLKITPAQVAANPILSAQAPENPGKTPYLCQSILSTDGPMIEAGDFVWLDPAEVAIDPREAARQVLLSLGIDAINIGLSPRLKGGANGHAYVGVPVWMWAANPSGQTVGPISAHNGNYGVLVTGEARLTDVTWNMGDGHTVHCKGSNAAGKAYQVSYGVTASPMCGYRYMKMSSDSKNGRYSISATSHWEFTWQAGGMQGMIPLDVTNNTTLPVGEIQVVVTGS